MFRELLDNTCRFSSSTTQRSNIIYFLTTAMFQIVMQLTYQQSFKNIPAIHFEGYLAEYTDEKNCTYLKT